MAFLAKKAPNPVPASDAAGALPELPPMSLPEASPRYRELLEKRSDLYRQDAAIVDEINAALAALRAARQPGAHDRAAAALLAGAELDDLDERPSPEVGKTIAALNRKRDIIRAAHRQLDHEISKARNEASAVVINRVRPIYSERVKAFVAALDTLVSASEKMNEITDGLIAADVSFGPGFRNVAGTALVGRRVDRQSSANLWIRRAVEAGMLPRDAAPAWVWEAKG